MLLKKATTPEIVEQNNIGQTDVETTPHLNYKGKEITARNDSMKHFILVKFFLLLVFTRLKKMFVQVKLGLLKK